MVAHATAEAAMTEHEARLDELLSMCDRLLSEGKEPFPEDLCRYEPALVPELRRRLDAIRRMNSLAGAPVSTRHRDVGLETSAQVEPAGNTLWPDQINPPSPDLAFLQPPDGPGMIGRMAAFKILGVLGRGGMGVVLRAEDSSLGREVALKCMKPELAAIKEARERFLREAKAAAGIDDPHVAPIHQVGESRGVPFLVMPLLKGRPLSSRLEQAREAGGPMPMAEAVRIGREMARGLAAAHALGIVHRDVKPANVWLKEGGGAVLLDFGLARVREGQGELTQTGQVMGTPAYMAPEQAECGEVDARADLFSLGCVLHEMLTGERAFTGPTIMAILANLSKHEPPPVPGVPADLSALVSSLLSKKPAGRPASAAEVAERLAGIERGDRPSVAPIPAPRPFPVAAFAAAAVVLLIAGGLFAWSRVGGPGPSAGLPPEPGPKDGPAVVEPPPAVKPLEVKAAVRMWSKRRSLLGVLVGVDPAAVPAREDDQIRVEAESSEPAFVYMLWIDTAGQITPLYPWNAGDDIVVPKVRAIDGVAAVNKASSPASGGRGWDLDGSEGLETILVLATRKPLPKGTDLAAVIGPLNPTQYLNANENNFQTFRDGKLVAEKPAAWTPGPRGPKGKKATDLDDSLLTAVKRLSPLFEVIQAVRFAHAGKGG